MHTYKPVSEDLMQITEYTVLGKLPNPFLMNDGSVVQTEADWQKRRQEILESTVGIQYGEIPPEPEFLEILPLFPVNHKPGLRTVQIRTGTRENPLIFNLRIFKPEGEGPFPTVLCGDLGFRYVYDADYHKAFTDNGIMLAEFDRTELAPDTDKSDPSIFAQGQIFRTYPGKAFSAMAVWAWGFLRGADALEKIGLTDFSCLAFMGHSRGAKTALLAGALDERATIVNPNSACAGGASCYRLNIKAINEAGKERPSETITITEKFPTWFGPKLKEYIGRENELPFDSHFMKALVAPRILLDTEAADDIWGNPVGSWQTTMGAREVFEFLGAEQNLYWHFRAGGHYHAQQDVEALISLILHVKNGEKLPDTFFKTPFKKPELMFDWRNPNK